MSVSEADVSEKLGRVNASQDSVQSASNWILENKDVIDVITQGIALIYVMNDVVQAAKREKDKSISVAFHPHFVNAIVLASDTVKKPIKRCLEVFRERHIYPKHVIDEMQNALIATDEEEEQFELKGFIRLLENYHESSTAIDRAHTILDNINFDLSDTISEEKIADQLDMEVDLMIKKLQVFQERIEGHSSKSSRLQTAITKSKQFFNNQLKDVAMVHDAYEKYAKGISDRMTQLEPVVNSGVLPGQTPPRDAPSPRPGEDPFQDLANSDDMEMDEEDKPGWYLESYNGPFPVKSTSISFVAPQDYVPNISFKDSTNQGTSSEQMKSLDPRQARMQASIPVPPSLPAGLTDMLPKFSGHLPLPGHLPPVMPFPTPQFNPSQLPPPLSTFPPDFTHLPPSHLSDDVDLRKEGGPNGQSSIQLPPPSLTSPSNFSSPPPKFTPLSPEVVNSPIDLNSPSFFNVPPPKTRQNGNFYRRQSDFNNDPPLKKFRRGSFQSR